jgi:magnesium transporter
MGGPWGHRCQHGAVITATGFRGSVEKELHSNGLDEFLVGGGLVWVDVVDATDHEIDVIAREFGLHPLAVEDARKGGQRPKIERFPTHALIVVYCADADPRDLSEMHIAVGKGWMITIRLPNDAGREFDIAPVVEQYKRTRGVDCSAGFLLHAILDAVVDGYFDITDQLDDELQRIEDDLFSDIDGTDDNAAQHSETIHHDLLEVRRSLVIFRRRVIPLREVLMSLLRREFDFVHDDVIPYLQDVLDHLLRTVDSVDSQRELVGNAVDAHLAIISNRANEIMKKMTSWGAILLGSTLIAGIYGMNFRHMPELGSRFGYPGALLSMVVLTTVLVMYFRRKKWL